MHEVPVQADGHGSVGVSRAELVLLAVDRDVAVAVDLAVDLDGLPGTSRLICSLVPPGDQGVRVRPWRLHGGASGLRVSLRGRPSVVGVLEVGLAAFVERADAFDSIGMDGRTPVRLHHDRDRLLDRLALAHPDRLLDRLYRSR